MNNNSNLSTSKYAISNKHIRNRRKHEFLLTFFSKPNIVEHKEVNGFILHRYFSNDTHEWEVAIYTPESWKKSQDSLLQLTLT
jgi:hypothetical protein